MAGATVNKGTDTGCPTQAVRDAGFTGTSIDASSYCQATVFVCSDTSTS